MCSMDASLCSERGKGREGGRAGQEGPEAVLRKWACSREPQPLKKGLGWRAWYWECQGDAGVGEWKGRH